MLAAGMTISVSNKIHIYFYFDKYEMCHMYVTSKKILILIHNYFMCQKQLNDIVSN